MEQMYFYLILTATLLVVAGLAIALYRCRRRLRQCQQAMVRCINENIEMKEKLPEYELPHFLNREDITPEEFTRIIHNMLKRLMFLSVFFLLASCPMATQEKAETWTNLNHLSYTINGNLARASALIGVKELKELSLRFAPLGVKPIASLRI